MNISTAKSMLQPAISSTEGIWADIGAGTGTFTMALQEILTGGTIYASDKNPHALWRLPKTNNVELIVHEGDFHRPLDLPELDGIIMANALHYSPTPIQTLQNILQHLKAGGIFIFIEYELKQPRSPWIPYPIPYDAFEKMTSELNLSKPTMIKKVSSAYGHQHIYSCYCIKE